MTIRTHTSSWRQALALGPVLFTAAIVFAAIQEVEGEIFLSRYVHLALVPVCLLGWWSAWRLAHVLSDIPLTPVGQARAGYVAIRGNAQAMPNQPPLTSPSGAPCLWYEYSSGTTNRGGSYTATDSVQPFLLVDGSGQCIVLPAGAHISGGKKEGRERLIVAGDPMYVAGEFRPVSADTLQQLREVEPERADVVSVSFSSDDPADSRSARERGEQMLKEAQAAKAAQSTARNLAAPLALPLVCAPKNRSPFVISANDAGSNDGSWYGLLASANLVLLAASGATLTYLIWAGR